MIEVEPGDWDALLARLGVDDVYLRREYVESACTIEPGTPTFLSEGEVVFACIVREFRGALDVTTPYGYGGPVAGPRDADAFYGAYREWCRERGVVSTFVRFHPLYDNQRYARIAVEPLGSTVAWRLRAGELFERMHSHHRRVVRKAQRAGLEVSVEEAPSLDEFAVLYERTMARLEADSFYLFTAEYWESLQALPLLLANARLDGEPVASVLCFAAKPWLHYHLGASSEEGRRVGASHLVLYETASWARAKEYELFHLGGGVGGRADSLYEFKSRFDPGAEREFAIGRAIHDETAYHDLVDATGGANSSGFFPAYRDTSRR
ncbi:MAG: lipid II:glycine glycyltransferase FemX [Gaiellaceae bacterium]